MKILSNKKIREMKSILEKQAEIVTLSRNDKDKEAYEYAKGMHNGMALMLSVLTDEEPFFMVGD